jgi:hypothetical protein
MSAPSSRRKAKVRKPREKREMKFLIVIEAQKIAVTYKPNWMPDMAQFEFRSPYEPKRRIPISETGYRSHFAEMAEVRRWPSPEDYARDTALSFLREQCKPQDRNQLNMF